MLGKIYLIRNLVNGKGYVGQTTKSLFFRLNQHKYAAKNGSESALHKALRKYGPENFEITQLVCCVPALLDDLEKFFIKFQGTYAPSGHGYNLTEGGDGSLEGKVFSKEGRESLRSAHLGNSYAKGHKVSDEARAKMSETHKGHSRPVTKESRVKNIGNLKGSYSFRHNPI